MTRLATPFVTIGACLLLLAACDPSRPDLGGTESTSVSASAGRPAAAAADFKSIAGKLVGTVTDVRENEIVQLTGNVEDLPLLEELAIAVRKRGAHPIVLVQTERLARRMYEEVPAKYDGQQPLAGRKFAEMIDLFIATEAGEGRTLRGVPPERQAARAKAAQGLFEIARKRGVRFVQIGNGLYPSAERAEQFGMKQDALAALMYAGIDTDYERLQSTGRQLAAILSKGKLLRITNPAGTDFTVRLGGRPVHVSDGVISAEDRRKGGTALGTWLPAGEVYVTPPAGTGDGVLVAERYYYEGDRIDGLRLELQGGKLAGLTAKSGLDALKARYDAAGAGRDLVGVVDIGINPSLEVPDGKAVNVWSRAGAVTVGIGNNLWAGGTNASDFGLVPEIAGATVTVDGREIVKDGTLVEAPAVAAR